MNETAAQQVLLVRAVESTDATGKLLTPADRGYAERAAAELVRWQATDRGERASATTFVAKRAELLVAKLVERSPRIGRILQTMRWRPWIGIALPVLAGVAGVAVERVADPGHVNILAFPLLGLVVWNVCVYIWLAVRATMRLATRSRGKPDWFRHVLAGTHTTFTGRLPGPLASAFASFSIDWVQRSAPLVVARAARILHLCAAALALGAIAGLYVRGLVFEYRAGWESTFLEASGVHRILEFFLSPAARLIGQSLPDVGEIESLRFGMRGGGENAARWIHLYTLTVVLAVVVPRLLLAAIAAWRERSLSLRFPLPLEEAYFRRLLSSWRESPAQVRVVPYAYTPAAGAEAGLQRLAKHLFGDSARLQVRAPVAFGDEESFALSAGESQPLDLVIALFNLGSTPETENHGVFLDTLKSQAQTSLVVVIDEAPYRQRLGMQAGAQTRLAERRQAWTGLAATRGLRAVFAELDSPQLSAAQVELDALLVKSTPAG